MIQRTQNDREEFTQRIYGAQLIVPRDVPVERPAMILLGGAAYRVVVVTIVNSEHFSGLDVAVVSGAALVEHPLTQPTSNDARAMGGITRPGDTDLPKADRRPR